VHAGLDRQAVEHGMVVRTMDLVVWRAVVALHAWSPARVPEAFACVISPEDDRAGLDSMCAQGWPETPAEKEARGVGRDLDACTHFSQHVRRLEQRDAVSGVGECVRRGEATESCANDNDVEVEGGATATVEGRHLVEGYVCH